MGRNNKYIVLWNVMKREFRRLVSRPLYLFCMVIAPLFCYIFFTTLMDSGLPTDMPVGVVDQDMTATSRQLVRNLDAFEQTAVVAHYPNIADARIAMQKGEIYGFYYIPEGTEFHESMMQYDVASTIAHIFGLKQPQVWIGRPMLQVFK